MKNILVLTTLFAGLAGAPAQQAVPREELLKITAVISLDLKQMLSTPIPTDPDTKRPVAARAGERGCLVLPESKLSAETIAKASKEAVPVGQLWLRQIIPVAKGERVKPDRLKTVSVTAGDRSETAILCALGAQKGAGDQLELVVYGKDKEPLLHAPLKPISAPQENPIEINVAAQGDTGVLTLKLVGKYEAAIDLAGE